MAPVVDDEYIYFCHLKLISSNLATWYMLVLGGIVNLILLGSGLDCYPVAYGSHNCTFSHTCNN